MRAAIFFVSLGLMVCLGLSSPIDRYDESALKPHEQRAVVRRSSHAQNVKGKKSVPHHHNPQAPAISHPELNLRKGEYMCSGRVCKLRPGEVPIGCNGICQYPV